MIYTINECLPFIYTIIVMVVLITLTDFNHK